MTAGRSPEAEEKQRFLRRKWRLRQIRRWAAFRFARLVFTAARSLPLGFAADLGAMLGRVVGFVARPVRALALEHLEIALGDRTTPRERRRIVSRLFGHLGRSALEFAVYTRLGAAHVARHTTVVGEEHAVRALAGGRGLLGVTPHFGLWEILPVVFFTRHAGCVVGVKMRFGPVDRFVTDLRASLGVETVHQSRVRELLRRLRRGLTVGILPDQDMDRLAGTFLPFFGRDAYSPTGPATLAWTARCAVVPFACRRVGRHHHRIELRPPLEVPRDRPREEWIRDMTAAINRSLEETIASDPSQWVWFHRRWSTTPEKLERKRSRRARTHARRTGHRLDTRDVSPR